MYDRRCNACGIVHVDVWEPMQTADPACACGGQLERTWLTKPPSVIGDETDVWVKHGICNEDGTPKHYRFKSEMRAAAKKKGLVNHVEHIPSLGSDKNRHTSRWV